MNVLENTLDVIRKNTANIHVENIRNVLIIYEEKTFYIGDTCILFDNLRYVRTFFHKAKVELNFLNKKNMRYYHALLANNPNFDSIRDDDWADIDFSKYDLLICVTYKEQALLEFLHDTYQDLLTKDQFRLAICSFSEGILVPLKNITYVFPEYQPLRDYTLASSATTPCELYLTTEENEWANTWLASQGVGEEDDLYIMFDSASERHKLLDIRVYFDLLGWLLEQPNVKVLIFDEKDIGKSAFYLEWLGEEKMNNIIISKKLGFREDLTLIGSKYTKVVLGPCTGLMHCASSIFNNLLINGLAIDNIPLLVTYTGQYIGENNNINVWWGNAPLVNCLLLKEIDQRKQIVLLRDLTAEERNVKDSLPCSEYTFEMLVDFLSARLPVSL
ncbi:glycosyltransferase family 9 protein [Chitinophaga rhizophila]|uniref:ADP-heptose:LPS heptosyltransferase n=1 Tax=Chitinophaga rhizophila TaxID=2866212 RepID=A0ABS7G7C9_9BACT|nr:hypothetical protein [Chitinophaga rhizophila]MBW8683311.1 hypothetical protein [Chitinophaga rhizophila]